jgi:hypothetical protein
VAFSAAADKTMAMDAEAHERALTALFMEIKCVRKLLGRQGKANGNSALSMGKAPRHLPQLPHAAWH